MRKKITIDPNEHQIQVMVCKYLDLINEPYFAIPNGANKSIGQRVKFKAEGLKSGVPDLFLPRLNLFIEMKTKTGKLSKNQKEWFDILYECGYSCVVAHGFEEAKKKIDYRRHEYAWKLVGAVLDNAVNLDKGRTGYMENNYE